MVVPSEKEEEPLTEDPTLTGTFSTVPLIEERTSVVLTLPARALEPRVMTST